MPDKKTVGIHNFSLCVEKYFDGTSENCNLQKTNFSGIFWLFFLMSMII